jgi:hypothetical protein
MTVLDQISSIPDGVRHIYHWLGEGGNVVDQETAQARANTCNTCAYNIGGLSVTAVAGIAIKKQLELKNHLKLRVDGEKRLKMCGTCGCQLKLLVWEPQERVKSQMIPAEAVLVPDFCWKNK